MIDLTEKYVNTKYYDNKGNVLNPNLAFIINEIQDPKTSILVMQGGTRSGKTHSAIEYVNGIINVYKGIKIGIVRQSMPVLKATVLQDFISISRNMGFYNEDDYNKTDQVYRHNGNEIWFISGDDEEKLRGFKSDILYINEAPELGWEAVKQLLLRSEWRVLMDYNPSYPESWMYDNILTRPNVKFIKTTYKHNPYLKPAQLEEIEWLRLNKPDEYMVYGLGERGVRSGQIYTDWEFIPYADFPFDEADLWVVDFGFSPDPLALIRVAFKDLGRRIYVNEEVYETELMTKHLLCHLFFKGFNDNKHTLVADSANPLNITELRFGISLTLDAVKEVVEDLGYDVTHDISLEILSELRLFMSNGISVTPIYKPKNGIKSGIRLIKSKKVYVTESSKNIQKEYYKYCYKRNKSTGELTGDVEGGNDHTLDGIRYAGLWHFYNQGME